MSDITIAELAFWRQNRFPHTLLDVRRKEKREESGVEISDSRWFNPADWLEWKNGIAADCPVVVYCVYGHEISQGLAAALRAMGVDARHLTGGIEAWREAGHPLQGLAMEVLQ